MDGGVTRVDLFLRHARPGRIVTEHVAERFSASAARIADQCDWSAAAG